MRERRSWPSSYVVAVLVKQSPVAVLALLVLLFREGHAWADEIPVCSMSRDEFVALAFPDTAANKMHDGKLMKRGRAPGLVVLAPADRPGTSAEIESAFAAIESDSSVLPVRSSFLSYSSFSDLANKVEDLGNDNVFIIIAEYPSDSSEAQQFRHALEYIVRWPREVEALIQQSSNPQGFTTRSRTDIETAEVKGTAVVASAQNAQIGLMVYVAYYYSISPSASSSDSFPRIFFEKTDTGPRLTDRSRRYFRVFADERVKNSATKDSFVECSG
jgi:hypothetical protein